MFSAISIRSNGLFQQSLYLVRQRPKIAFRRGGESVQPMNCFKEITEAPVRSDILSPKRNYRQPERKRFGDFPPDMIGGIGRIRENQHEYLARRDPVHDSFCPVRPELDIPRSDPASDSICL